MLDFFFKIRFYLLRPKIVLVAGEDRKIAATTISKALGRYFKLGQKLFIFETDLDDFKNSKKFEFLIKHSSLPVLVLTNLKKDNMKEAKKLAKIFAGRGKIILNFEDENTKELKEEAEFQGFTFGFGEGSDFKASDIKTSEETNFKLNYGGSSVPVWIQGVLEKNRINAVSAAVAVGVVFGLNLIEISQSLKNDD